LAWRKLSKERCARENGGWTISLTVQGEIAGLWQVPVSGCRFICANAPRTDSPPISARANIGGSEVTTFPGLGREHSQRVAGPDLHMGDYTEVRQQRKAGTRGHSPGGNDGHRKEGFPARDSLFQASRAPAKKSGWAAGGGRMHSTRRAEGGFRKVGKCIWSVAQFPPRVLAMRFLSQEGGWGVLTRGRQGAVPVNPHFANFCRPEDWSPVGSAPLQIRNPATTTLTLLARSFLSPGALRQKADRLFTPATEAARAF